MKAATAAGAVAGAAAGEALGSNGLSFGSCVGLGWLLMHGGSHFLDCGVHPRGVMETVKQTHETIGFADAAAG